MCMPVCYAHWTLLLQVQTLLKQLRQVRTESKNRMILESVNLIETLVNLCVLNVESISVRHQRARCAAIAVWTLVFCLRSLKLNGFI